MDDRRKTISMIVLCCLLFLFAGARFWSMAADSRQQAELNSRNPSIQQQIVSKYGPPGMKKAPFGYGHPGKEKDPFGELGLTAEQRRKIDDIMNSSMPNLPPPGPGEALTAASGLDGPHVARTQLSMNRRIRLPMDKIRAILTPEQQQTFDQMH